MLALSIKLPKDETDDWIVIGSGENEIRVSAKRKAKSANTIIILIDAPNNYPIYKDYASKKKLVNLINKIDLD